jgi:hypothetical protein
MDFEQCIRSAALEAQTLLDALHSAADPSPGSALDQAGLRNGFTIVDELLVAGELGLAFEHLLYMVAEPRLTLSASSRECIAATAKQLGMTTALNRVRDD